MNGTYNVAEASLAQKMTVFVDILELDCVAITAYDF